MRISPPLHLSHLLSPLLARKRKKGGLKLEGEEDGPAEEEGKSQEEGVGHLAARTNQEPNEDKQQKKADDLWASFLSDVGSKPKPPVAAIQSSNILKVAGQIPCPSVWLPVVVQTYQPC